MLLFWLYSVTFIITGIRVSITNNPAVTVSFVVKFVVVSNVIVIQYNFFAKTII